MESYLYDLAPRLGQRVELDVVVYTQTPTSSVEQRENFRLHRLSVQANLAGQPVSFRLPTYLRSIPSDIVHIHHPNPYALLSYRLSGHPGKLVVTYHSDIVRQKLLGALIGPVLNSVWAGTSAFLANSAPFAESSPVLRRFRDKVHIVPLGIQPDTYLQPITPEAIAMRSSRDVPMFLCVGRFVEYKGFLYAIQAIEKLRRAGVPAHLTIAGDGPLRAQLQEMVRQRGLEDCIAMPGRVANIVPYYQACDAFLLPSCDNNEALGLVQVEAMLCGKPVINTALPTGVPHVSVHGQTGLTVPPRDSSALADAMALFIQDSNLRRQMGEAARSRALAEFTVDKSVDKILPIYEQVLQMSL